MRILHLNIFLFVILISFVSYSQEVKGITNAEILDSLLTGDILQNELRSLHRSLFKIEPEDSLQTEIHYDSVRIAIIPQNMNEYIKYSKFSKMSVKSIMLENKKKLWVIKLYLDKTPK